MPQVQVPFQVGGWEPDPAPLELGDAGPVVFGRVTMRKTFSGALTGSSVLTMTSAAVGEAPVGYSALELVTGTLDGRTGTFVLQHSGTMTRGSPELTVSVVPDSGSGELTGLSGTMRIIIEGKRHSYEFDYTISIGMNV